MIRFAIAGLRHVHINALIADINAHGDCIIVAISEEDDASREAVDDKLDINYQSNSEMIQDADFDVLAIGDTFGKRGAIAIEGLKQGKHILSDKPICTSRDELEQINTLAAENNRCLGLMLDLRDAAPFLSLRELLKSGEIGEIKTIHINGMHPLAYGTRPSWFFEKDQHGGTFNDIAVHLIDYVPWLTGEDWSEVLSAHSWHTAPEPAPWFMDSAQAIAKLEQTTVMMDVSYWLAESSNYATPCYWRTTVFGSKGMAEIAYNQHHLFVIGPDNATPEQRDLLPGNPGQYFRDFLSELDGKPNPDGIHTEGVLKITRQSLLLQEISDSESKSGSMKLTQSRGQ
ncbi:MAG: Gfo/Idh/MocA family oxidoreductase [Pirellulales bacterium]